MDTGYLLVLTATVTPAANAAVKRKDPVERLNDYISSLEYRLECSDERLRSILFLENSGADLAPFRELVQTSNPYSENVELITVPGNQIPAGVNYGYGEMEMRDHGLGSRKGIEEPEQIAVRALAHGPRDIRQAEPTLDVVADHDIFARIL
jgi:hypothetical protein